MISSFQSCIWHAGVGVWEGVSNDFEQAGALYRLIDAAAKQRLVDNIAGGLAQVNRREIVDRAVSYFRNADPEYGDRIERAIDALHS